MTAQKPLDFDNNPPLPTSEYDQMVRMGIPGYENLHTMAVACFRSKLPETANLLIVGAGSGMELVTFGKANSQWQMLGVDPSANMLQIAQQKIEQEGLSNQIKLFQGYTHELPATPLYDGATCILVMHFIPDDDGSKLALLESISQRLKSSAALILVDWFGEKGSENYEQLGYICNFYRQEMGMNSEAIAKLEKAKEGVYPIPEPRVLELLKQAGFSNIMKFYTGLCFGGWIAAKN